MGVFHRGKQRKGIPERGNRQNPGLAWLGKGEGSRAAAWGCGYVWTGTGGKVGPEPPKEASNDSLRGLPGNYGQHRVRNCFVNTGVRFRACAAKMN